MRSAFIAAAAFAVAACTQASAPITTSNGWAAATPNGVTVAAGYLTIANAGNAADTLVSAASPRAARVELHEMTMNGAMMQMRPATATPIPAHGQVALAPGGAHLMFVDITAPFVAGETVPVTLTFEHAGVVSVALPVRAR